MSYLRQDLKRKVIECGGIPEAAQFLGITVAELLGYMKGKSPKARRIRQFMHRGFMCSIPAKYTLDAVLTSGVELPVDKRTLKSLEIKNPWLFAEIVNGLKL